MARAGLETLHLQQARLSSTLSEGGDEKMGLSDRALLLPNCVFLGKHRDAATLRYLRAAQISGLLSVSAWTCESIASHAV